MPERMADAVVFFEELIKISKAFLYLLAFSSYRPKLNLGYLNISIISVRICATMERKY